MFRTGSGKYTYEWVEGWPTLPDGWTIGQNGVATDSEDRSTALTVVITP